MFKDSNSCYHLARDDIDNYSQPNHVEVGDNFGGAKDQRDVYSDIDYKVIFVSKKIRIMRIKLQINMRMIIIITNNSNCTIIMIENMISSVMFMKKRILKR